MFTVIAMGKYNQRTPGKTPKTPQSRGHPSFCLWNIDYVIKVMSFIFKRRKTTSAPGRFQIGISLYTKRLFKLSRS